MANGEVNDQTLRAVTVDELRDMLLRRMVDSARYWANQVPEQSIEDRCTGVVFSVLSLLDGTTVDMPAFDLVARPHPDDKQYCIANGENWIEPGTVICDTLHEHYCRIVESL